jgi:hypothetical protein
MKLIKIAMVIFSAVMSFNAMAQGEVCHIYEARACVLGEDIDSFNLSVTYPGLSVCSLNIAIVPPIFDVPDMDRVAFFADQLRVAFFSNTDEDGDLSLSLAERGYPWIVTEKMPPRYLATVRIQGKDGTSARQLLNDIFGVDWSLVVTPVECAK